MKKEPIEQIIEWLMESKVDFAEIASVYVSILEQRDKDSRHQISDLTVIASMYRNPKMNAGSKKDLEKRFKDAIVKTKVFKGTKFEKELLKT